MDFTIIVSYDEVVCNCMCVCIWLKQDKIQLLYWYMVFAWMFEDAFYWEPCATKRCGRNREGLYNIKGTEWTTAHCQNRFLPKRIRQKIYPVTPNYMRGMCYSLTGHKLNFSALILKVWHKANTENCSRITNSEDGWGSIILWGLFSSAGPLVINL